MALHSQNDPRRNLTNDMVRNNRTSGSNNPSLYNQGLFLHAHEPILTKQNIDMLNCNVTLDNDHETVGNITDSRKALINEPVQNRVNSLMEQSIIDKSLIDKSLIDKSLADRSFVENS